MAEESGEYRKPGPIKKTVATVAAASTFASAGLSSPVAPDFRGTEVTATTGVVHTTEHKHVRDEVPEIYARLFSKDPEAGKLVDPNDVEAEYTKLENLLKAGYHLDHPVKDIGVASDDDDTTINGIRTGGLGVNSEKNVHLGDLRGTVFRRLIDTAFEDHGIKPPQIQVYGAEAVMGKDNTAGGIQVMNLDTKAIQEDVKYIRKVAKQRGIPVGHLLDEFNGIDGNLPPGNDKLHGTLHRLLKEKREIIFTYDVTDEQGRPVKIVHKTYQPPAWFVPIAELTEEFAPKQPQQENGRPPKEKGKVSRGFAKPIERIVQPRYYNNDKTGRAGRAFQQHRTGQRSHTK